MSYMCMRKMKHDLRVSKLNGLPQEKFITTTVVEGRQQASQNADSAFEHLLKQDARYATFMLRASTVATC